MGSKTVLDVQHLRENCLVWKSLNKEINAIFYKLLELFNVTTIELPRR